MFRLVSPEDSEGPKLSINSDDPLTFATCLADEYAHLEQALMRLDYSTTQILDWLDKLRHAGWESRFTTAASARPAALDQVIGGWWAQARGRE